ncbi:muscular LMNA-interacting protein isoform X6 [Bufo gargarizans]|uniref:muscular LMNA-interacting protein isoform X6 n=1 Tax=Bufo gargarizans TaxID=30331 RepID=UPI001CF52A93|nr:muscular LMNA-interacting protein isoform X6 [Bufo gargarizans]
MDFKKKNKSLSDRTLRQKSMGTSYQFQVMEALGSPVDSGTIPVTFTFVPSVGTLPSEVVLAKESNYVPKIVSHKGSLMQKEENITPFPCQHHYKPPALPPPQTPPPSSSFSGSSSSCSSMRRSPCRSLTATGEPAKCPEDKPEKLTERKMHESPQSMLNTAGKATSQDSLMQTKSDTNNPENINHKDLFIAEFVVVMDDDEDEIITKEYQTLPFEESKHKFRETPQRSWQPKVEVKVKELYDHSLQENCCDVGDLGTKLYKIKSSYKAFAAIPTNTLLLDQKAIDDPQINRRNSEAEDRTDAHTEMCSPALLRQQTEEICAVIDEVLHDPFPTSSNSVSRSPKLKSEKKSGCVSIVQVYICMYNIS